MTQEYAKSLFEYRDGNLYWKVRKSHRADIGDRVGSKSNGYEIVMVNGRNWRIHRLVYLIHHGRLPEMIDHINGNRSDNRIENLRESDTYTNGYNAKKRKDNVSGVKGVSWNKDRQTWAVRVNHNKKTHQWYVKDLELAELVAIEARLKLHGQFSNHGVQ